MISKNDTISVSIKRATYLDGFRVCIDFTDGIQQTIDFKPFLEINKKGYLKKYSNPSAFKNFTIENGNLVWGKDWDLIFPISQLYKGAIQL